VVKKKRRRKRKRELRYVAVCVDGRHIVIGLDTIREYRELDNGFMFKSGSLDYYSPYFFPHHDLDMAWRFANNCADAEKKADKMICPDKA